MKGMVFRNSTFHSFQSIFDDSLVHRICEMQATNLVRRFPTIRIASLRPHWCIPDPDPLPAQILPHSPITFQTTTFSQVLSTPDSYVYRQLWGWNTYTSIARAFYLAITVEDTSFQKGHEVFFIVSPKIGSRRHPMEVIREYFPNAVVRKEFGEGEGLYDVSKAERLLGWRHDDE